VTDLERDYLDWECGVWPGSDRAARAPWGRYDYGSEVTYSPCPVCGTTPKWHPVATGPDGQPLCRLFPVHSTKRHHAARVNAIGATTATHVRTPEGLVRYRPALRTDRTDRETDGALHETPEDARETA